VEAHINPRCWSLLFANSLDPGCQNKNLKAIFQPVELFPSFSPSSLLRDHDLRGHMIHFPFQKPPSSLLSPPDHGLTKALSLVHRRSRNGALSFRPRPQDKGRCFNLNLVSPSPSEWHYFYGPPFPFGPSVTNVTRNPSWTRMTLCSLA